VGPRMGYRSLVVLPAEMSAERFEKIRGYGAEVIATPGCESNVKEIYDEVRKLRARPQNRILNQFEEFGNYRFHFHCTAPAAQEAVDGLGLEVGAFVSAMGSAGTIAAGEALRQRHPAMPIVALEPVQCPTLYDVGFGGHRIEGIGDKHVTWIHNVRAIDLLLCIDDLECLEGLQLLQEGTTTLEAEGVEPDLARSWVGFFGVSGVCNVLGAIRAARHYGLGPRQAVVTVATDGFDRYPSVLRRLDEEQGTMDAERARRRLEIFRSRSSRFLMEGTPETRRRWHNQKYFTWVEQQGRSVEELRAQEAPDYWVAQQERAHDIDRRIRERRA
jgi:cysteine synthase A